VSVFKVVFFSIRQLDLNCKERLPYDMILITNPCHNLLNMRSCIMPNDRTYNMI